MAAEADRAQAWLERMADFWLRNPRIAPAFPPGLIIRDADWRVMIEPGRKLTAATMYERIKTADEVEFYAVLADGSEVTTRRPMASMESAAVPSWQRRERTCCCGDGPEPR